MNPQEFFSKDHDIVTMTIPSHFTKDMIQQHIYEKLRYILDHSPTGIRTKQLWALTKLAILIDCCTWGNNGIVILGKGTYNNFIPPIPVNHFFFSMDCVYHPEVFIPFLHDGNNFDP